MRRIVSKLGRPFSCRGRAKRTTWWLTMLPLWLVSLAMGLALIAIGIAAIPPESPTAKRRDCFALSPYEKVLQCQSAWNEYEEQMRLLPARSGQLETLWLAWWAAMIPMSIIVWWMELSVTIRRLHDVGESAWSVVLILIPIIGIYFFWRLGFVRGEPKENQYGPPA